MSALGGILSLSGAPLDVPAFTRLGLALARRGPDGGGDLIEGPVALAYRAFHAWTHSREESQPARSPEGVVLTWDGRLDNGPELRRLLELGAGGPLTDTALVLAAYERWRLGFLPRLVGDFALALWDPRSSTLVLARDPFGVRPLFYRRESGRLLWATRLAPLLSATGLTAEPDDAWIGNHLTRAPNVERTPYRGLLALPPGHCLEVNREGQHLTRFWSLQPGEALRLGSDAEYEERLRELFLDAVRARLRVEGPVFAELSGGVDSSSVACVARHLLAERGAPPSELHTVSLVYEHSPTADERPFIRTVEEQLGQPGLHVSEEHLAFPPLAAPSPELPTYTHCFRGQYDRIGELMQERGARVLLTGFAGDGLFWSEMDAPLELADLLYQGQPGAFLASLRTWKQVQEEPYLQLLWRGGLRPLLPEWVRRRLPSPHSVPEWVAPAFAAQWGLREQQQTAQDGGGFELPSQRAHHGFIRSDIHTVSWLYGCNGATLLEVAHPFLHRPLVEFCMALPLNQLLRGRETRSLHRRALREFLPKRIAQRRSKQGPEEAFYRAFARQWSRVEELLEGARVVQRGYVEPVRFRETLQQARFGHGTGLVQVLKVLALEYWLRALETGNLGPD
jgi:asparagine synthase (glutamine-hydrolysing)